MKVIQPGNLGKKWKKTITCAAEKVTMPSDQAPCGAVLEVTKKDLFVRFWVGTHGGKHYYAAVECPQCGKINSVSDVPAIIFKKLNKKSAQFDGFSEEL